MLAPLTLLHLRRSTAPCNTKCARTWPETAFFTARRRIAHRMHTRRLPLTSRTPFVLLVSDRSRALHVLASAQASRCSRTPRDEARVAFTWRRSARQPWENATRARDATHTLRPRAGGRGT